MIILHHSVTGWNVSTETIRGWGYNRIIRRSGEVLVGKGGVHTYGHNSRFGVCFIGNYNIDKPTQAQIDSLIRIMRNRKDYNLKGHKDFANNPPGRNITSCPGKNLYKLIPAIREEAMENYKAKWQKCDHYRKRRVADLEKCRKNREVDQVKILKLEDDIKKLNHDLKKVANQQEIIKELEKRYDALEKENKRLRGALKSLELGFWDYIRLALESLTNKER